jgi:hypothetical protein
LLGLSDVLSERTQGHAANTVVSRVSEAALLNITIEILKKLL